MKIPHNRELWQKPINYSSDTDYKEFINPYKKCTAKSCFFLVNDITLASDNPLRFKRNLLERIQKLIITIEDKIRDEKLQYSINREAAKISALSSGTIDKYEYLTGEEILPSDQSIMIKQTKFTYSPLGKTLEKQTKTQVDILKSLNLSNKIDKLNQIERIFP